MFTKKVFSSRIRSSEGLAAFLAELCVNVMYGIMGQREVCRARCKSSVLDIAEFHLRRHMHWLHVWKHGHPYTM